MRTFVSWALMAVTLLWLSASCTSTSSTPVPRPAATATAESEGHGHEAAEGAGPEGRQLFVAKGCVACHGQDAEGTDIAPALAGHSGAVVKRQVRAPVGTMPVFSPDRISNAELNTIATYIESLPGEHTHRRSRDVGQEVAQHHWMALFALAENEVAEAEHHVQHIIELVTGDHLARMHRVQTALEEGRLHDAAHTIEEMLAGTALTDLTEEGMHLRMALSSVRVEDATGATHHLEHYIALATGHEAEEGEEILALVQAGKLHDAEHKMEALLGGPAEGDHADGDHDDHKDKR